MKILIAGGSGLIGQALTARLISAGHHVSILSRNPDRIADVIEQVAVLVWDGKTTTGWGKAVNEVDAVVNLAGAPLNGAGLLDIWLTKKRRQFVLNSRLDATKALLDAVEQAQKRPDLFLQASAIGYYGPRGDEIITEDAPAGTDFLAGVQNQAERVSMRAVELGLRHVIFRTGLVLDGADGALQYFKFQHAIYLGGKMGAGNQYYSWIHLSDEAAALQFLIENEQTSGVYNLTAPNPVTNQIFSQILGKVMNRPSFIPVPGFVLRGVLGEISTVILDGQRVLPTRLRDQGFEFTYPHLEEALKDVLK